MNEKQCLNTKSSQSKRDNSNRSKIKSKMWLAVNQGTRSKNWGGDVCPVWGSCQVTLTSVLHVKEQSLVSRKQLKTLGEQVRKVYNAYGSRKDWSWSSALGQNGSKKGPEPRGSFCSLAFKKTFNSKRLILPHWNNNNNNKIPNQKPHIWVP